MIKYFLLLTAALVIAASYVQAQISREEYIRKYYPLAISEMERSGIPASIILAQGCWESQNGNSILATEGNNHFGIKCKRDWDGRRIFHDDDDRHECFRRYASAEESYIDHSNFLMNSSRYSFLFQLDPKDYVGWANGLKQAGYATDPSYPQRLIKIIEDYKLYLYDEYGDNRQLASLAHEPETQPASGNRLGRLNAAHKVVLRNGLRTIVVEPGDSYESLTKILKLKPWELYTYNDFSKGRQLRVNEILYIQPKFKRADRKHKTYVAEDDDTMHYISQRFALKLKPLLRRNRMKYGDEPTKGQLIYLREKRPRRG
jgi:hypothetical protein